MFSKIYLKYDLMNHLMSFNFDKDWREDAANEVIIEKDKFNVLDVASGTGDLAIAINKAAQAKHKKVYIYAYDFNADMLDMARSKFRQEGMVNVKIEIGTAFKIAHKSNSVDVLTSAFALRSFANVKGDKRGLQKFISESYRVLRPGGKVVLLDMAMPDKEYQRSFFKIYSYVMLAMGSFVDRDTYAWLVRTIKSFDKKKLVKDMKSAGFKNIRYRSLKSGIAYLVTADKP